MNEITKYYYDRLFYAIRNIDLDDQEDMDLNELNDGFHSVAYEMTQQEFGKWEVIDAIEHSNELNEKAVGLLQSYYL